MKRCWDNDPEKRPMASEIYEVIKSWENNYKSLLNFNKFETILEESGAIHPQAVYTSRFISFKELVTINSQAVCTNGIINDDNKIIESQENNKIIESQENYKIIESQENNKIIESQENNKIIESQENNKIIESQEDNIPIERMNKLMLEIKR
ncbi:kinase-like protein [Gigaspora margarita]|uniref:Kinase-like protein n=1 Tax=Gigaspora margarita TaxID=4874 RepID=A0A8H4AND0_GIGMA|nr:kinase-like protein [Gigaspora margarita]